MTKIDASFNHNDPARGYAIGTYDTDAPVTFPYATLGAAIMVAQAMATNNLIIKGKPITIRGDWSYYRGPVATVNYRGRVRYL